MTWPADTGVLLVAHGTVENLDDLGAFVAKIRHGRPAPPGLVEELRRRYEAIGGSPLLRITHDQAQALAKRLEVPVLSAMRLWEPGVERALAGAEALGLKRLVVIALAPFSQHVYWDAARKSADAARSRVTLVRSETIAVAGLHWDTCDGCGGAWLDGGELSTIAADADAAAAAGFFSDS